MPRTTLALLGWLTCFSASSGGVLSAVTWSCLELFTYLLHENRQQVMQKVRIFVPKPWIARISRMVRGSGQMAIGESTSSKAMAKGRRRRKHIRRQDRNALANALRTMRSTSHHFRLL